MECLPLASSQGVSRRVEEKYNTGDKDPTWSFTSKKYLWEGHEDTKGRKKMSGNPRSSNRVGGHASSCHHHS